MDSRRKVLEVAGRQLHFMNIEKAMAPKPRKMSPGEYIRFCDFCLKNNPHITSENCLTRKTGEEEIKIAFHIK